MDMKKASILFFLFCFLGFTNAQVYYRTKKLSVNSSSYNEMAPVIYKNGIVFSSNKKNDVVLVTVDQDGGYMYNLYFLEKKGHRNWGSQKSFASEISTRYNESSACFSSDWNTMYYTATVGARGKVGDNLKGDTLKNGIFISNFNGKDWSIPEQFEHNNPGYDVGYPSLSNDGNRLYFSSKQPGGSGNFDIYYSDKTNGRWDNPVNIGDVINTSQHEVFPFISNDNRLYFASAGHAGQGGLDIFYSDLIDGQWNKPINMPRPFNSRYDDFAFVANAELDTGYFSRSSRGISDDIYSFVSTFPAFTECPEQEEETFCYEFYESGSMKLDTTSLRYEWDFGDGTKVQNTRASHCFEKPGYYLVQMNVIDTLTGDVYFSEASYDLNIEALEQPYMISPDTSLVGDNIDFDASKSNIKSFLPENYYWDFGDGTVKSEINMKHQYKKKGTYIVRLGLTGFSTDKEENDEIQKACASKRIIVLEKR